MDKYAWKGRIRPGMMAEYRRRHDALWPEMAQVLREAGIHNYSIWTDGEVLFGYYECSQGIVHAQQVQAKSPVVARWNAYMADVLDLTMDESTGAQPLLKQVFELP